MKVILDIIIIGMGYYSFSYGVHLWKVEFRKLAGFGVFLISLLGILIPIVTLHIKF
jgi:hypothetical protein